MRLIGVVSIVLALAACSGIRGETKTVIVKYDKQIKIKLTARNKPASPSTLSAKALEASGHVRLGAMSVTHIEQTCFPLGKNGQRKCYEKKHDQDSATRLLRLAAKEGADLVVFSKRNAQETGGSTALGKCIKQQISVEKERRCEVSGVCKIITRRRPFCIQFERVSGSKYMQVSTAKIWRLDSELAKQVHHNDAIVSAVVKGDVERLKKYVAMGATLDRPGVYGNPLLDKAIGAGKVDMVRYLLAQGVTRKEISEETIKTVVKSCDRALFDLIYDQDAQDAIVFENYRVKDAIEAGCPTSYSAHILRRAPNDKRGKKYDLTDLLVEAVKKKDISTIRMLIEGGVSPKGEAWIDGGPTIGKTKARYGPILHAAHTCDPKVMNALIGIDFKFKGLLAIRVVKVSEYARCKPDYVKYLLKDRGVLRDIFASYLHTAVMEGEDRFALYLLGQGVIPTDRKLFIKAIQYARVKVVRFMVNAGVDVNQGVDIAGDTKSFVGYTNYMLATLKPGSPQARAYQKIRQILIAAGAKA